MDSVGTGAAAIGSFTAAGTGGFTAFGWGSAVFDEFADIPGTDLASHTPNSGGSWSSLAAVWTGGQLVITAGGRARSNVATTSVYQDSATPPSADYNVSATIYCYTNPTVAAPGVAGRIWTSTQTLYFARYRANSGYQLWKYVAGTATQLGSTYSHTMSGGESHQITLSMLGTSISMLVDGAVLIGPITDSSITAAGYAGLYDSTGVADTDSTGIHLTNFTVSWGGPALGSLVAAGSGGFQTIGAGAATWSGMVGAGVGTFTAVGAGAATWPAFTAAGLGMIGALGAGAATWPAFIAAGLATGGGLVEALFLPYQFSTTLIPAALDTSDAFGIDPGQTAILSSAEDLDAFGIDPGQTVPLPAAEDSNPFDIDPGQTTLILTGLDTGP